MALSIYLELANPQTDSVVAKLSDKGIDCVHQEKTGSRNYWKQVRKVCEFVNTIRAGNYIAVTGYLISIGLLRQTNFKCTFNGKAMPLILPRDLPLQNMVLTFIQISPQILKTVLVFSELWNKQCTLLKRLARTGEEAITETQISQFKIATNLLESVLVNDVFFIKSVADSTHADELAWLNFVREPTDDNYQKWKVEYLVKYNEP